MSLAENLLNTLPNDGENTARIANPSEEPHIIIDESRNIIVPQQLRNIAVTGDKDVETVTFDCVRYWDGHDLSNFAIYLNYTLPVLVDGKKQTGTYIPTEIRRFDNYYSFDWTIDENLTGADGQIEISLVAVRTDEDGYKEAQWGSFPNHELTVTKGLPISNVPSIEEKQDILSQILGELNSKIDAGSLVQTTGDSKTKVMSQKATTDIFATKSDLVRNKLKLVNTAVAYAKSINANTAPYAEIVKIGGMTYKDGNTLKSAAVTEVESVGVNLTTAQEVYKGAARYLETTLDGRKVIRFCSSLMSKNKVIAFKENTQYTVSGWFKNEKTSESNATPNAWIVFFYTDGTSAASTIGQNEDWRYLTFTSTKGKTVEVVGLSSYNYTSDVYVDIDTFMFNEGATALPYRPYTKNTLAIPEAARNLDGYGEGIDTSYQNVLDFEKTRYIQWVRRLSQSEKQLKAVTDYSYSNIVFYQLTKTGTADKSKTTSNILVSNFPVYTGSQSWDSADRIGTVTGASTYDWYWFGFPIGTTLEQAQSVINDCDIVVTLSAAKITDISDILTADNFIGVEGNGSLTFVNEFGYDVPSEVNIYTDTNSGTGAGDMSMAVYDHNGNGVVDKAEQDGNGNNIASTYASKANLSQTEATLTNLIANLTTQIAALTTRVAELESGNSGVIGVGTNVTGKTIMITCKADAEQTTGANFDVLDFGNGNCIEIDVTNGYYQGYGAFEDIYDRSDFEAITYNGGGTIAVYNKNYILLEYV